jgi:hypothetical protein
MDASYVNRAYRREESRAAADISIMSLAVADTGPTARFIAAVDFRAIILTHLFLRLGKIYII